MKTGMESEAMDRDVVAPRRRVAEPIEDQPHGHGHLEAPVLIRLPDLYPSARDDAAVARLAGSEPRGDLPELPEPSAPTLSASEISSTARTSATTVVSPLPGVAVGADVSPVAASPSAKAGHAERQLPGSLNALQLPGSLNALVERFSLPKAIQAAERYDVGTHVFRVLLVLLLVASIYLVFERSRQDAALSKNTDSPAVQDARWERDGEGELDVAARDVSVPTRPLKAETDVTEVQVKAKVKVPEEAPVHRVANRSEPSARTNPGQAGTPTDSFPSTPVNYDQRPAGSQNERARPKQEIPWRTSEHSHYPAPESSGSNVGRLPPRESYGESRYSSTGSYAPSDSYAPANSDESSVEEDFIPPYTPVTLRPRSDTQYPPASSQYTPAQPNYPATSQPNYPTNSQPNYPATSQPNYPASSPYPPPTTFSPPAPTGGNASAWPMENAR